MAWFSLVCYWVFFSVNFVSNGSGAWCCGFLLVNTEDDVPIGEPCMLHKWPLIAEKRGNCSGLAITHSLAALTASVVFFLLSLSAMDNCFSKGFFFYRPMCCSN